MTRRKPMPAEVSAIAQPVAERESRPPVEAIRAAARQLGLAAGPTHAESDTFADNVRRLWRRRRSSQ